MASSQGLSLRALSWLGELSVVGMDGVTVGLVVRVGLVFLMKKRSVFLPLFISTLIYYIFSFQFCYSGAQPAQVAQARAVNRTAANQRQRPA